jgi:hypothetical protein
LDFFDSSFLFYSILRNAEYRRTPATILPVINAPHQDSWEEFRAWQQLFSRESPSPSSEYYCHPGQPLSSGIENIGV